MNGWDMDIGQRRPLLPKAALGGGLQGSDEFPALLCRRKVNGR